MADELKRARKLRPPLVVAKGPIAVEGRGHFLRLSDPAMRPAVEQLKQRIASDPAFALSLLQRAGIATPTGKLTKRFGG